MEEKDIVEVNGVVKVNVTKWRCVNEVFGYCTGEPEWKEESTMKDGWGHLYGTCKNDHKSCIKFRWLSEMVDVSSLPEPNLVETFTPPEPPTEKPKPKTARARKLEAEIAQQKLEM